MLHFTKSPWSARIKPLLDVDAIRELATIPPIRVAGLSTMPIKAAADALERGLKSFYYPTSKGLAVMLGILERVYEYYEHAYPDVPSYLERINLPKTVREIDNAPTCLTGPAGNGKSQLILALQRVLSSLKPVELEFGYRSAAMKGIWRISVNAKSGIVQLVKPLFNNDGNNSAKGTPLPKLLTDSQFFAYRDGVALLCPDEFQFMTSSTSANARITQVLLYLRSIGILMVYVANYSMCHKLVDRNAEDKQRLLSDTIVFLPDAPNSDDWIQYLAACNVVSGKCLSIDPEKDAAKAHWLTHGLRRMYVRLVKIAYIDSGGGPITIRDLERAYLSSKFSTNRKDIEVMRAQDITRQMQEGRKDLWCPFDLPEDAIAASVKNDADIRQKESAIKIVLGSMNQEERRGLKIVQNALNAESNEKRAATKPGKRPKIIKTAQALTSGMNSFSRSMASKQNSQVAQRPESLANSDHPYLAKK